MSGKKEKPNFIRSIIQKSKEIVGAQGLSNASQGTTYMTPGEYTSGMYQSGLSAEATKEGVYSPEERRLDDAVKKQMAQEIADYQRQEMANAKKDIDQGVAVEKSLKDKIDAEKAKLTAFRLNPTNQGTGLGSSLLNPEAQLLYDEMEKNVNQNLSPIIQEYEAAKKANLDKAKEFTKTQEYLKATKRIKELEEKSTVFNSKNIASAAIGASSADPIFGQVKMYAVTALGGVMQNLSKTFSPTEENLGTKEREEYLALKKSVRSINTPLVQDFVDNQKKFLEQSRFESRKNRESMTTSDKFLDHFSDLELERAVEGGEDYLQNKGGSDIFLRELSRISVNQESGLFEDMQRNLVGDFVMKDNLFDKEKEVGFDNLSPTEQLAFKKYEAAQHLNTEMADKHGYGYNTVKGTMGSLAFVRDMVLPSKFMTYGGKLFSLERAAVATNAALKAEALAGKTAGKLTEMGVKGGAFGIETAATTYLNPRNINENKDPMGLELVYNSKGEVVDALTRQDLYDFKKKSLEKERIRMTDAKRKLEAKSSLSQEDKNLLKTVKARLGEEEMEGMISIDDQLSNYEVSSDAVSHIKGIASTAVEKVSELYTKDLLHGIGKGVTKFVPGGKKLASLSSQAADYAGSKFYSTGMGRAYKNWNNLVGKLTVGDHKIIGSMFEEVPEEYVAAVGNSILDWNTRELEQTMSTQGTLDILGQTALMNAMMTAGQGAHTSSKLLYNKVYNNKLQALNKRLEDLKKVAESNPEDKDTAKAIQDLEKDKTKLQERSTVTGLGITSRLTGDKTGFSSTKRYIDNRKEVRDTVEQLRKVSTDEAVNTALDVSTLSMLTASQKDEEARTLRAQGKNKEAELIEKSMFRDLISKAFDTNTQDELKYGLDKAMKSKGISVEKLEQLSQAKDTLEQLIEVQEKYKDNRNVGKAVQLTYETLSAKAEVKNVERDLAVMQDSVKERIDALARVKGLEGVDYSLDTLFTKEFEDPKEQEKYNTLLEEIQNFPDDQVQAYMHGLDLKNDLEQHAAEALITKNELLHPTLENLNGDKFLKEVSKAGKNLMNTQVNSLNLENIEYDKDGKIVESVELVSKVYDKLGETWIGEAREGKISKATFEKLKRKAISEHQRYETFIDGMKKFQAATEMANLETQVTQDNLDTEDLDEEDTTNMVMHNVALEDQSVAMANSAFDDFYSLMNQASGDAIVVNDDDLLDAFGEDDMIFSSDSYTKVQEDLMKEKVVQLATHINSITGQNVSLTQVIDFYFRSVTNKAEAIGTFKYLIKGWELSKNSDGTPFTLEAGEVAAIWNRYFPLTTSEIAEDVLTQFAESLPNIHIASLKTTEGILNEAIEAKTIAENSEPKTSVTSNIPTSEIENLEAETFAITDTVVESQPKVGFNTMPYEVVNVNGVVKKRTKGSLLKDFTTDPMKVDPRPLLDPNNGPTMTLGIEKSSEEDWDKIQVSNGVDENFETQTIPFSQWVAENKSKPNFKELFSEKVPYFYTFEGKRVGYVHDTDWYNEFNVPNPLKNNSKFKDSIAWQQEVEAGKRAERKLRKAIEEGLTEVTANKPETVKYHTINPLEEPLLTLRESNPQGIIAIQKGSENLLDSLPQDLRKDFESGRKKIINRTDSSLGAINSETNGHTWYLQRVGTEINPVTKEKVETYQATKTQGYVDATTFSSLQWAVVVHKVLNNINVPVAFNQGLNPTEFKKYIQDNFSTPIYKTMGLNLQNPADLGKYVQHFAKISPRGLATLNASKIEKNPNWKNVNESTSSLAYQYFLLEQNYTLEALSVPEKEILLRSASVAGVVSNKKVLLLNGDGAYEHKTPAGETGSYTDFLRDTVKTEIKAFDMSTTSTPIYALGMQPVIHIDYTSPSGLEDVDTQANIARAAQEAKVELALEESFSTVEAKKADIEKRRQEELNNNNSRIIDRREIWIDEEGRRYAIQHGKDGTQVLYNVDENDKNIGRIEQYEKDIDPSKFLINPTMEYLQTGEEYYKSFNSKNKTLEEKINAKYDAELAALEESPIKEEFDNTIATDYLESLGVNIEDFTEEEGDDLIGDISKIQDLFNLTSGLSTLDEVTVKEQLAHSIISKLSFKSKVSTETKERIKEEVKKELESQLKDTLTTLNNLASKVDGNSTDSKVRATAAAIQNTISTINAISENIDSLYGKALQEVNKQAKVDLVDEIEEENDATLMEKNYSKESVEESLKTKASSRLRMLFSGIPQTDSKNNVIKGFLGFPRRMALNDVYNQVLRNIAIGGDSMSDFDSLIKRLEESNSMAMKEVVKRLKEGDSQIQNEFVYNVVAHTLTSKFAMFEKQKNGFSLKMYDTNSNEITRVLKNIWKENSIASDLYNYDGSINVAHANSLIEEFEDLPADLNLVEPADLKNWLSKVGMEMSDETWNQIYAVDQGLFSGSKFISFKDLYSAKQGGLFFPLVQFLRDAVANTDTYSVEFNKSIFSDLGGISNAIVKIEARYNPQLLSLSFRDGDKSIFTQTPPKYATDKVTELVTSAKGNKEYLDKLRSISFTQDSLILDLLNDNKNFRDLFKIHHSAITSLKEKGTKSFGKSDITSLSDIDYDVVTTTGFSDRRIEKLMTESGEAVNIEGFKLRLANMLFPTMSDKSTGLFLTTPVFDFLDTPEGFSFVKEEDSDSIKGITQDVKEILFKFLVVPEIKRIHKFFSEIQSTNIKGYDKGAGMFHLLPVMNTLTAPDGNTLLDVLKNNAEIVSLDTFIETYGDLFKDAIEGVVKREVNLKLKEWAPAKTKGPSAMFGTEYFTAIGKNPVKDYEAAVYDYVMNSMISNAEMFKVFAGDVALYSQDKVFKKELKPEEYINASKQIGVNLGKRLALLIAPGKKIAGAYTESEREYNQIFLKDSVDITQNASFLIEMYYGKTQAKEAKVLLDRYARANKALNFFKQHNVSESTVLKQKEKIEKYQQLVNKYRNELKDTYKSIGDYFNIESTDAQEYTTVTEHVNILSKMGRISTNDENSILNKLASNQDLTKEELSLVMQPIKPVYTGSHINEVLDVNHVVYIKSSSFPLIPQLTAGTQLDNLRQTMEQLEARTGRFTRASYQTANKVGSVLDRNTIDPLNKTELSKVFEGLNPVTGKYDASSRTSSVMVLDRNNFRIQQDVPFKSDKKKKDEVALGTQIFKLLFGDGVIDEVFETKEDGTKVTGKDLYKDYNQAFTTLVNIKKEELFDELGLNNQGKVENEKDFYNKLQNLLIKEATDRGYSLKSIRGLSMETLVVAATGQEYREFKTPLWLSPDSNRYESLLNSIITNRVMKHKMPGNGFVAGSESGFKFQEDTKGLDKSRVIFLDGWNGEELQGTSITQEDGVPVFTKAQVFAPSKFKNKEGKLIDLFTDFNGTEGKYITKVDGKLTLKEGMIDKETLNLFSFRTPTSSHVSASSIEVVGILPPESGDLMIVPKNFTKQKGLDYDIDKESAYQLTNYVNEAGQIKVLDKEAVAEETKTLREKLERIHLDLLSAQRKGYPLKDMFEETMAMMSSKFNEAELERIFKPEISLSEKLKVLDRSLNRKLAENTFIKTSLAVYNSTNLDVQKRINKILSMDFAKGQAEAIERMNEEGARQAFIKEYKSIHPEAGFGDALAAYEADMKNFSILNYSYQKDKMKLGSVGKSAIGVYANYTTYNGLIQTHFGNKGMFIMDNEGEPRKFTLGKLISTRLGGVKTLDGGRTTSEVFAEKENTATDNEKEQILGRVGVNELTINVDSLLTLRGFDKTVVNGEEYSIPYLLLSQPTIKDYVKVLKESKGLFGEFVTKEAIIDKMVKELSDGKIGYDVDTETMQYAFRETDSADSLVFNGSKKLTGANMIKGIEENGKDKSIQLDAFMSFIELDTEARHVAAAQKVTNINSLGKSMVETTSKNESLATLATSRRLPSAINLLGEVSDEPKEGFLPFQYDKEIKGKTVTITNYIKPTTPQGQIVVNGLYYGNELFKEFFPYREKAVKTILREIGLPENENARIDKVESIFEEIKKYFYSNPNLGIFSGDTSQKRYELFVDDATNISVSSYLRDTLKAKDSKYSRGLKAINNNPLLRRMVFESGKGSNKFSLIKYNNAANDNLDEESLYNSLPELVMQDLPLPDKNGQPYSTRKLAEDLTAYAFLEGGVQEASQFIKFVPVELLEAMGKLDKKGNFLPVSKVLRMLNSKVNTNRDVFGTSLGVKNETMGGVSDFTTQYFQHYPKQATRIKADDRQDLRDNNTRFTIGTLEAPIFVYVELVDKTVKLYKHIGSREYVEIDILKGAGASQYQFKNSQATNLIQQSVTGVPTELVQKDIQLPVPAPAAKTPIQKLMEDISAFDLPETHQHLSVLAKWLAPMTKQDSTLTVADIQRGAKGSTNPDTLNITLNKEIFSSKEELATTMVHEFIHHVTTKELAKYFDPTFNSLVEDVTIPKYVYTLSTVFENFKKIASSMEGFEDFNNLLATYKNQSLPMSDRQNARAAMALMENRKLFYAASNIKEFITGVLTESTLQNDLSKIPYKDTDKSILDKVMEMIAEIFSAVYPSIKGDTLAFDALKTSMNFIETEYNKRENNSISLPNKDIDKTFFRTQEDSLMYKTPDNQETPGINDSDITPDMPEETPEEDELPFLTSVGLTMKDWNSLTEQEKQKIKDCN